MRSAEARMRMLRMASNGAIPAWQCLAIQGPCPKYPYSLFSLSDALRGNLLVGLRNGLTRCAIFISSRRRSDGWFEWAPERLNRELIGCCTCTWRRDAANFTTPTHSVA
jgi:hypothetical protein